MPTRPPWPQRKRRTREHVIADLSINHLERFIYRCGWVAQRPHTDYGVDLFMEIFSPEGEYENGRVWFQVKATDSPRIVVRHQAIAIPFEWQHAIYWLNEREPGILVAHDAASERAWWIHLQEALREQPGQTLKRGRKLSLRVPLGNRLDEAAIRHFAELRETR